MLLRPLSLSCISILPSLPWVKYKALHSKAPKRPPGDERDLETRRKTDAHFVVSVKGAGAITGVELKAIGTDRAWDSIPGNEKWGMIVQDGKGEDLTTASGSFSTKPFLAFITLHL